MVRLPKLFADADETEESGAETEPAATASQAGTPAAIPVRSPLTPTVRSTGTGSAGDMALQLQEIRDAMEQIYSSVKAINERETSQEKVFNALYSELHDYKNDFIYEHLKPMVRPLLFLYDSLEQFDQEITPFERPTQEERRNAVAPSLVRQNISYFKEQLVEALRICEVTIMEPPAGEFDPKLHKVIEVVAVEPDQDKKIQRVIRNGWYLNSQLLRPAEVVIGRRK